MEWSSVIGGLAAIAGVAVAFYSVRSQERTSAKAINAQAETTRSMQEHERQLALDERLWNRRADLYARISLAMRSYIELPPEDPSLAASRSPVPEMGGLVSEAEIVGSKEARELVSEFVYDDPPVEEKIDLWSSFQAQAGRELRRSHE